MSNKAFYSDREFVNIISPILEHEEFQKTKNIVHHGINRYDHSVRVAYYSYKICKMLHLNYRDTARGGVLHDFFLDNREDGKITILFNHPKYALETSKEYFILSDREQDIIRSHMFPVNIMPPKYLESWIVDMVDNVAGIYEKCTSTSRQVKAAINFLLLIVINSLR